MNIHRQRVSTTLLTRVNSHQFCLVLLMGFEPRVGSLDLESDALSVSHPDTQNDDDDDDDDDDFRVVSSKFTTQERRY